MAKKNRPLSPDEPLRHPDHPRPVTRREFIRQGFIGGSAMVTGGSALLNLLLSQDALAASNLSQDIIDLSTLSGCTVGYQGAGKIPFICFDLAGGANLAGSNVIVGGPGGQNDPLSTQGYSKLGIPGDRVPDGSGAFTNGSLGLMFHSESALLAGILSNVSTATAANTNGFVIPARSDNDTSNNPHNPMYGIAKYGAKGGLLGLIGSVASDSGGNSMAPAGLIDLTFRPTKISRPSDASGLVDTGNLTAILNQQDALHVMESSIRISHSQIGDKNALGKMGFTGATRDLLNCGYLGAADNVDKVAGPDALNPLKDQFITQNLFQGLTSGSGSGVSSDSEFLKTASVMKLVINGFAGAGTITMGGFDYHTGDRRTGELRDLRAGRCIGACLEYAAHADVPLMIYVFSDGSLFSNGTPDGSGNITTQDNIVIPGGKGVWTGDNSSTACSFVLVYNPPRLGGKPVANTNQLGNFQTSGSVNTSARTASGDPIVAANNVTSLVYTVLLNYMALHGEQGQFSSLFPDANLGGAPLDQLIALGQIVNGTIV